MMRVYSEDEKALILLDAFVGLSKEQKLQTLRFIKKPSLLFNNIDVLRDAIGNGIKANTFNALKSFFSTGEGENVFSLLAREEITVLTCMSDGYPERLLEISDPPLALYCKGNIGLLNNKNTFSIVGSRKTLPEVLIRTESFAKSLSSNGVVLLTGLAEGVDASVIKGSLDSGNIISVLPCGFCHVYPEFHRTLFERICKDGLVVSEYNPEVVCKPYFFPERNRLIAALGNGVLVASAGKKSGTSYTADYANEYGKAVFAFPYNVGVVSGEGCNAMIKEYAMLCDDVSDIYLSLGIVPKKKSERAPLDGKEKEIYSIIRECEIHVDLLLLKTGMQFYELSPVLTMLEMKKYIVKNPGNTYSAVK